MEVYVKKVDSRSREVHRLLAIWQISTQKPGCVRTDPSRFSLILTGHSIFEMASSGTFELLISDRHSIKYRESAGVSPCTYVPVYVYAKCLCWHQLTFVHRSRKAGTDGCIFEKYLQKQKAKKNSCAVHKRLLGSYLLLLVSAVCLGMH